MTITATDNFVRSNGALGANWTPVENVPPVISGNGFTNGTGTSDNNSPNTTSNTGSAFWNANTFGANQAAFVTIKAVGATGTDCVPGVIVRGSRSGTNENWYAIVAGPNTTGTYGDYCIEIWKMVNGTAFFLSQSNFHPTIAIGDVLGLYAVGTEIVATYNGAVIGRTTDASLSSGQPGITVFLGTPGIDHPAATTTAHLWNATEIIPPDTTWFKTLATDDFQRANETPMTGFGWTTVHTANIVESNLVSHAVVKSASATPLNCAVYPLAGTPADQWSEVTVGAQVANDYDGPLVRGNLAGVGSLLRLYINGATGGNVTLGFQSSESNGQTTLLSVANIPLNIGDKLKIAAQGNVLSGFVNGVFVPGLIYVSIPYPTGNPGLSFQDYSSGSSFTAWSGGSLVAPPPAPATLSQASAEQGATIAVFTVSGTSFDSAGTSTLSFSGTGITINSYGTRNATTLVANITLSPTATLGARDVTITNADTQTGLLAGSFTVTTGTPAFSGENALFLGSVVEDSTPALPDEVFLGTVQIVTAGPGGATGPFLGKVRIRNAGTGYAKDSSKDIAGYPWIGAVVVVTHGPGNEDLPVLGLVDTQ